MGYRSQVVFVLTKEAEKTIAKQVKEIPDKKLRRDVRSLLSKESERLVDPDGTVLRHWESIKWYEGDDPVITWIAAALDALEPTTLAFFRVGEDVTDCESRGELYRHPL